MGILSNLQQKPEKERKKVALMWTIVVLVLIVGMWLLSFNTGAEGAEQTANLGSPFEVVKGLFSEKIEVEF